MTSMKGQSSPGLSFPQGVRLRLRAGRNDIRLVTRRAVPGSVFRCARDSIGRLVELHADGQYFFIYNYGADLGGWGDG